MDKIDIPDNVPADVVKAVTSFLESASAADATGGGISVYGLYVLSESQQLCFAGCSGKFLQDAIVEAIVTSAVMEKLSSGQSCTCPECCPPPTKDDKAVPNLFKRIFGRGK